MTDPDWCFKNPASAAADIDALLAWKRQHEAAQTSIAGRYWENRCREAEAERDALAARLSNANADMLVAAINIREQAGEIRLLMGVADMLERSAGETYDQDQETR